MKEFIGKVTEEEKNEMLNLHKKKMGLEELPSRLDSIGLSDITKNIVLEKIILESQKVKADVQAWWNRMFEKYNWKKEEGKACHINFETREIFFD
ncbi:CXXX repeat peptide modification system protein [Ruminiclostridium herbifermentans]|uniref:CXXX repeat peptide modification system protein n=2 Tax=Ruminiclostridium herbifermentans TaxID=2488810 RepID=A0A4U7JL28_9FIRM|nr:CXXX repeat peptide modification system protein [Ruminiclostridium herbifermentans]